jgi:hypothetical protein
MFKWVEVFVNDLIVNSSGMEDVVRKLPEFIVCYILRNKEAGSLGKPPASNQLTKQTLFNFIPGNSCWCNNVVRKMKLFINASITPFFQDFS